MENTFVMIKPDGVRRKLVGEIIQRLENKGLDFKAGKLLTLSRELAETHYQEHRDKPFFSELIDYICSGPVMAMVWSGPTAIAMVRKLVGHKDPVQAEQGSIRADYAFTTTENLVHASDSQKAAEREIQLFFGGDPG